MTEAEIRAYTAGYKEAVYHFRSIINNWAEAKDIHQNCQCVQCLVLRQIAEGRYGGMGLSETNPK
jgi:hypothetical protein